MPGAERNAYGLTEAEFLQQYSADQYDRPSVTADAVIFTVTDGEQPDIRRLPEKVLRVLLVRRADHPFLGHWALPGGFVRLDESLEQAATRHLQKETGLSNLYLEQLYTWGEVDRDPRTRVISASYLALVSAGDLRPAPGQGTTDVGWFDVRERTVRTETRGQDATLETQRSIELMLSNGAETLTAELTVTRTTLDRTTRIEREVTSRGGTAFDHATVVHCALERLRSKLEWTDLAFHLVPQLFTLKELQLVYEVILGREILDMQFRRHIDRFVLPTNQTRTHVGHRPARLYRFNPRWQEVL